MSESKVINMDSQSLTQQSIDRTAPKKVTHRKIREKIPDHIAHQVVEEVLSLVGDADWNDPRNVPITIAKIMSIDTSKDLNGQYVLAFDVDRTILVTARDRKKNKDGTTPYWICQSVIRVDDANGNRYIEHNGSKYNKIDIIFGNKYFRDRMNQVAKLSGCIWNARWGNSRNEKHKLYQKTRPGEESWLDKCVKPLINDEEETGINIRDLVMVEFKRKL